MPQLLRGVAQPGSALGLGPRGRRFESSRPDQLISIIYGCHHWRPYFIVWPICGQNELRTHVSLKLDGANVPHRRLQILVAHQHHYCQCLIADGEFSMGSLDPTEIFCGGDQPMDDARPLQEGLQCIKMIPAIPFNIVLRLERAARPREFYLRRGCLQSGQQKVYLIM